MRDALQALPETGRLEEYSDLYAEAAAILEFDPRLLFLNHRPGSLAEDLGAVRLLRGLSPGSHELTVVLVARDEDLDREQRRSCEALRIPILDPRRDLPRLAQLVANAGRDGVATDDYLQFVQGICDEINNPLMFATGHLQLLRSGLHPERDGERLTQVEAIRSGLARIQGTMRKVATMGRASRRRRETRSFPVGELVDAARARLQDRQLTAELRCGDREKSLRLDGDLELLAGALCDLSEVGVELAAGDHPVALSFEANGAGLACAMRVDNPRLQHWELPRAFEPYRLNEVLRGTTLGLNLFLVRLVAEAHGFEARARRTAPAGVEFCIAATPDDRDQN